MKCLQQLIEAKYLNPLSGAIPRFNSIYGQSSGPVWIPRVSCSGDERSLFDCTSSLLDAQVCSHSHDAGVECPSKKCILWDLSISNKLRFSVYVFWTSSS